MALLPGLQEPAAPTALPQEPAIPTGPTMGQRATDWFKNRYLTYSEPDEYLRTLTLDAMRVRATKGPEALVGLDKYKPEDKKAVLAHMEAFDKTFKEAEVEPLRANTIFRETGTDKRLFLIASQPGGLDIIEDLAKQSDNADLHRAALDSVNMANLARVGQVMMAGETTDPAGVAGLPAMARGGAEWGASLGVEDSAKGEAMQNRYASMVPGGSAALLASKKPGPIQQRQIINAEYQAYAYKFAKGLERGAAKTGLPYTAPASEPQTVEEARKLFLDALPTAEGIQQAVIGMESKDLGLYGPDTARKVMGQHAKLLFAVAQKAKEEGSTQFDDLGEIQAVLEAFAAGEQATGPGAELALAVLRPAFWVLDKVIGAPDRAVAAMLYGKTGRTAPTKWTFADGHKSTDFMEAAEYSMKILNGGGEYRSPQWLIEQSAQSRRSALEDEFIAAEFPLPGQKDAGGFSTLGRGISKAVFEGQDAGRRLDDWIMGGEPPIDAAKAARPVVEYGLTEQPEGGGPDWGKVGAGLFQGEGQFIGEVIRENTSTKADKDLGYRIAGWTVAEIPSIALSPWNFAHTGQVRMPDGTPRVYKFTDGRQMNKDWVGVRDNVATALGAGGKGDIGGSGEIADILMTTVRDTPGQSFDEAATALKNTPGFLDEIAFHAENSGLAPWVTLKAQGMNAAEYAASRNRAVAELFDDALGKTKAVIEQAPMSFGYKDFWTSPSSRVWKMQAKRGLYFGPIGVPLGPMSQMVGQVVGAGVRAAEGAQGLGKVIAPFSALKRASQGIFMTSHVATQTPALGTMNALPNVIRLPYRMKKAAERHYRLQAAQGDANAQRATHFLVTGGIENAPLPSDLNRSLITLMVEGGRKIPDRAAYLVEHAGTYDSGRTALGWRPAGATKTEQFASALAKAQELDGTTTGIQIFLDRTYQNLERMGIADDADRVREYVTHFFHGPGSGKAARPTPEFIAKLEQMRAASMTNPSMLDKGKTMIPRVGPVSIVDALKLGGYQPEMDIARLLHYRTTQAMKAELDGAFMSRIARTFGVPMLRGKDAAVQLIQAVRGTGAWQTEQGFARGVLTREAYARDLHQVSRMIRDKSAQLERSQLAKLGQELGVPLSKFHDERMLLGAMLESETFLRRASSKLKSSLDKMMTPEARGSLRDISREMLANKTTMRNTLKDLKSLGVTLPDLADLADVELATMAQRMSGNWQMRAASVPAIQKDLKVAQGALKAAESESAKLGKTLTELGDQSKKIASEQKKIVKAWDKAKVQAQEAGLNGDDLARADDVSKVRKQGESLGQAEAFQAYKDQQAAYVRNAQAQKQLQGQMGYERGQANRLRSFLDKAKARVAAHQNAIKGAKAQAADLAKRGGSAKTKATLLRGDLDKAAEAFIDSSRAFLEARRGIESILGSGQAHGAALALRGAAKRVAAHGQMVRSALASFEMRHGVSAQVVRQRALTPRTVSGAGGALKKQEAAALKPVTPSKPANLPHSPAQNEAELMEYSRAQDALDALEMGRSEQSALLWEIFGARTITEVPLHELRILTDPSGPMRASIIRFIVEPYGDATRAAARWMDVSPDAPAIKVGRALGVSMTGTGEEIAENIESALTKVIADAEKGSERATKILAAIPPADLAKLYNYKDISAAAKDLVGADGDIRKWVATMSSRDRGSLERQLRTTFIPVELGLAMKTLMGEGVFKKSEAVKISLATQFGNKIADILQHTTPVTRGFKTAAIGYRASLLPGRRNSLFDGVRSMIQLGTWGFFSLSARKSFLADIASPMGQIQTATGLVDRAAFHQIWEERGAAMFGAMADGLEDTSRTLSNALKDAKGKRFIKELEEVGKEGKRTTGINIPKGAVKSAGIGGAFGEAIADDLASGAALGFGFYGFLAGATGTRRVVHSSGQIASGAEWLVPVGPQALERLDNRFRKFVFWTYVKSGMAPADAMDLMLTRMRDMTNLTPMERKVVQHVATVVPVTMFYNFTKQNGIAQLVRFLDNPVPTVAILRTFRDISDDSGQDPDTRSFWQNMTDTIVREGKAWNLSDETTAALQLLSPITGLLEGTTEGRPLSGFAQGVMALGKTGQSAPIWKHITGEANDISLPLPLASKILNQYGPFNSNGIRAYINEQGVPRVDLSGALGFIWDMTGAGIAANDVARLQMHGAKDDWTFAVIEALGGGRIYDPQSSMEAETSRHTEQERKLIEVAEWLSMSEFTGDSVLDTIGLDYIEKAIAEAYIKNNNGKDLAGRLDKLRARFNALKGKNRKALAGQNPNRN